MNLNNKTKIDLPDGLKPLIISGEYRFARDLFYLIWFFSNVCGCVVGAGDFGVYDFVLAENENGKWKIIEQSDAGYRSPVYALRDLIKSCETKFGL
jgi:hypothetical protein